MLGPVRIEELRRQINSAPPERRVARPEFKAKRPEPEPTPIALPAYVDFSALDSKPPPPRRWVIPDWIPRGAVTNLDGPGGVGKSLLAQQLETAVSTGSPLFGKLPERGPAIGFFCEDDNDELARRQIRILATMGRSAMSADMLYLEGRAGQDNCLVTFDSARRMVVAPFMAQVEAECARIKPALVLLDNKAQVYGGLENDRYEVTAFCNLLTGLARRHDCAVLLLGHVAKADDSQYSGSTAWDAAVRSRLWMSRRDDGLIELRRAKANYAALGSVLLEYRDGAFAEVRQAADSVSAERAQALVLAALDRFTQRQIAVSHSPQAPTYLVRMAVRDELLDQNMATAARAALTRLLDDGALTPNTELPWRKSDRHWAKGLARSSPKGRDEPAQEVPT